jgi:hypothetical protein
MRGKRAGAEEIPLDAAAIRSSVERFDDFYKRSKGVQEQFLNSIKKLSDKEVEQFGKEVELYQGFDEEVSDMECLRGDIALEEDACEFVGFLPEFFERHKPNREDLSKAIDEMKDQIKMRDQIPAVQVGGGEAAWEEAAGKRQPEEAAGKRPPEARKRPEAARAEARKPPEAARAEAPEAAQNPEGVSKHSRL